MKRLNGLIDLVIHELPLIIGVACIMYAQNSPEHDLFTILGTMWTCTAVITASVKRRNIK